MIKNNYAFTFVCLTFILFSTVAVADDQNLYTVLSSSITSVKKVVSANVGSFEDVTFSSDGKQIATSHNLSDDNRNAINLWNAVTLSHLNEFTGHEFNAQEISFTQDGKYILSTSEDSTIRLWDINKNKEVLKIQDVLRFYYAVKILPTGDSFIVGGSNKIDKNVGNSFIRDIFIIRNIFMKSPYYLQLRDIRTGKVLTSYKGHNDSVTHIEILPNGKNFITASLDGSIRLWDIESEKHIKVIYQHPKNAYIWALSVSSGGKYISFQARDIVYNTEIASGKTKKLFDMYARSTEFILDSTYLMIYSPGRFVIRGNDGQIMIDVSRKDLGGYISAHAISPDKQTIALGFTEDGTKTQKLILIELKN